MSVSAEDRTEDPILKPACEDFLVFRIAGVAVGIAVAPDIRSPAGNSRNREVQSCWDLFLQCPEIAVNVAGPCRRRIPLLAEEGGPRQHEDTLLIAGLSPVFVNAIRVEHRKDVRVQTTFAKEQLAPGRDAQLSGFRFRRIKPECIYAFRNKRARQHLPIQFTRRGIGNVVISLLVDEKSGTFHLLVYRRGWIKVRPDRNHHVRLFVMDLLYCAGKVRIAGIEVARSPLCPPLPILNDRVERNMTVAVLIDDSDQLILSFVAILRLEKAIGPFSEQRRMAGQFAILMNDLVGLGTINEVVIQALGRLGAKDQRARELIVDAALRSGVP